MKLLFFIGIYGRSIFVVLCLVYLVIFCLYLVIEVCVIEVIMCIIVVVYFVWVILVVIGEVIELSLWDIRFMFIVVCWIIYVSFYGIYR